MESILDCPTFLINLPRCSDRLHYSKDQLNQSGYTQISVFTAIDGMDASSVEETLKIFDYHRMNEMNRGALGCLLSHMKLLKHIIDHNIPIANIFEDDIHFHPEWNVLSKQYYSLTPADYEVLFIGSQLDVSECSNSEITRCYCYCTHAYIITLEGAKKMLDVILHYIMEYGLLEIDCIFKEVIDKYKYNSETIPFVLYSWNGTKYPCYYNSPSYPLHHRNSGLVFQNMSFISQIDDSKITREVKTIEVKTIEVKKENFKKMHITYPPYIPESPIENTWTFHQMTFKPNIKKRKKMVLF